MIQKYVSNVSKIWSEMFKIRKIWSEMFKIWSEMFKMCKISKDFQNTGIYKKNVGGWAQLKYVLWGGAHSPTLWKLVYSIEQSRVIIHNDSTSFFLNKWWVLKWILTKTGFRQDSQLFAEGKVNNGGIVWASIPMGTRIIVLVYTTREHSKNKEHFLPGCICFN